MWSVAEVTDASGLNPGSVRHILQRLFADGLAARIRIDDSGIGNTRIWYELTEAGERRAKTILKYLPDPIGALHAWLVEHPDDQ